MRTVFFILACIIGWCYGLALAGTEREARIKMLMQRHPNSIFLPMPEAMVTEEKTGSKAEGLCISGDEEHVPILYWEQQDMLRIDFPEVCRYHSFVVGDVIGVSIVCTSREEREQNYLALEDYLPACMEAINPAIPNQSAGLQALFDHREYHADRVRGFCTRVPGHNLNEPGIRGLSNSSTIISQ